MREMPLFKTNYSKRITETLRAKAIEKIVCMNKGHRFMLVMPCSHQVVAVARGARRSERIQRRKKLNVRGNSMTLRHLRLTHWDRTSFDKLELFSNSYNSVENNFIYY